MYNFPDLSKSTIFSNAFLIAIICIGLYWNQPYMKGSIVCHPHYPHEHPLPEFYQLSLKKIEASHWEENKTNIHHFQIVQILIHIKHVMSYSFIDISKVLSAIK